MSAFREGFPEYYPPSESDRKQVLLKGLVCLDTNVLLDAYRFAPNSRNELLDALRLFGDRLWIPHQVALEFHKNRVTVISKQGKSYKDLADSLGNIKEEIQRDALNKAQILSRAIADSDMQPENLLAPIIHSLDRVIKKVEELRLSHGITLNQLDSDPVLEAFESIFANRIGSRLSKDDEIQAKKEADQRAKLKIPPGYKDAANKDDAAGDYLVWNQILIEAKKRSLPILFVTRDVKEDWFRREGGRTLSARPELVKEAREYADVNFIIMETKSFLYHVKQFMRSSVSSNLIRQVEELPPVNEIDYSPIYYRHSVTQALSRLGFEPIRELKPRDRGMVFRVGDGYITVAARMFNPESTNIYRRIREAHSHAEASPTGNLLLVTNSLPRRLNLENLGPKLSITIWRGPEDDSSLQDAVIQNSKIPDANDDFY